MSDSNAATAAPASPDLQALVDVLGPSVREILEQVQAFRRQPPTPERTCAFERQVAATLREAGRVLLERVYNALEPERLEDCPLRLRCSPWRVAPARSKSSGGYCSDWRSFCWS